MKFSWPAPFLHPFRSRFRAHPVLVFPHDWPFASIAARVFSGQIPE